MIARFKRCVTIKDDSRIVIKDKGSKNNSNLVICNPNKKQISVVRIDDCVIRNGERCDYLVLNCEKDILLEEIFVELKGSDVKKAICQLEKTIVQVSSQKETIKKRCFIIVKSHCPKTSGELQVFQQRFKKNYNSTLIVREHSWEYEVY